MPDAPPVTSAIWPSSRMAAQRIACAAMPDPVTVIGASGALGSGLALRLARGGRARRDRLARRRVAPQEAAARVASRCRRPTFAGSRTARRPSASEIVILSVPFRNQSETLTNLKDHLREASC